MQNTSKEEITKIGEENVELSPAQQLEFLKSTNRAIEDVNKAMEEYIEAASGK